MVGLDTSVQVGAKETCSKRNVFRPSHSSTGGCIKSGNYKKLFADIFLSGWEAGIPRSICS